MTCKKEPQKPLLTPILPWQLTCLTIASIPICSYQLLTGAQIDLPYDMKMCEAHTRTATSEVHSVFVQIKWMQACLIIKGELL